MAVLKKIKLAGFRCYDEKSLDFDEATTLILGKNGCGKTSVLEAVYISLSGKSFRAVDREIIKRDAEFYRAEVEWESGEKVIVMYDGMKKTFLIKDKKFQRLPRQYRYPIVLFLPSDLSLVEASPSKKRDYFDRVISQINPSYVTALNKYTKVLRQRNELLKKEYVRAEELFSWDVMMAKYGVEIRKGRAEIIKRINEKLTETYRSIAENEDKISLKYISNTGEVDESGYLKLLNMDFERDKLTGHTNFGVHKDDFEFYFNGSLAAGSASRGEVRSIVIALKFIEAKEILKVTGKKPIVLLDDVFSELDETRQKSLVKNFKDHQVILTSVEGVEV